MRPRRHLLRVVDEADPFSDLAAEAGRRGLLVGWLELGPIPTVPDGLVAAVGAGVAKAVTVGPGGSVAFQQRLGPPVLRDVLRRHFAGYALVLVRGEVEAPLLRPAGEVGWQLGDPPISLTTDQLLDRLRRARLL